MRILLVYPKYPDTFWGFKNALDFISKKAVHPPLGLLTVAALLPADTNQKLVDLNIQQLKKKDLEWADMVFLSAMAVQEESVREIVRTCRSNGVPIVAGGPLFSAQPEKFPDIDHLVLGEAEITLPHFLDDLKAGNAKPIYRTDEFPDIATTPPPVWPLVDMKKYLSMTLQYSRGCPFSCDFCDITTLYGRKSRTKSKEQVLVELEQLYQSGWRGSVFFVDDNFIGNRKKLKAELLPALIAWMDQRRHPFKFNTEASVDIADDDELMTLMIKAGFDAVFIGIESPDDHSLLECNKFQNRNRSLSDSVKKIQAYGLQVNGGFIVGFDSDTTGTFQRQVDFIQKTRIITAMVGMLNAPRGTSLYARMKKEGRLVHEISGNNADFSTNIIPRMGVARLRKGYEKIISGIYSAEPYYRRVKSFLTEYKPLVKRTVRFHVGHLQYHFGYIGAFAKIVWKLGLADKSRQHFWKLVIWTIVNYPKRLLMAITFAVYGYHFRQIYCEYT